MWAAQSIGKQNKTKEALLNRIETAKIILEKDAASVVDKRANVSLQLHLHLDCLHSIHIHFH